MACRKMVEERSGLNHASLRKQLIDDGIALRSSPSYRKDIERLQTHTTNALRSLRDLSQINLDRTPIHINRGAVHKLEAAADQGSYLITGHPGAGKSGTLHDLAELLWSKGDVVCLASDRLEIASLPALRVELGLEHDVADVFANCLSSRPGHLLIDALDAARGTRSAYALLELT
jgi:predicted ATP-dependent serine protease